jgi:uncharacterized protein YfaS (alpha-2-macroglobulin family)/tetratricopeptide (TPR) repeat protein
MRRVALTLAACVIGLAGLSILRAGDQPKVPENVRELMQDRRFDEAAAAIEKFLAAPDAKPKNPDYLLYLEGRALHLAGKHREALETFARFERDYSDSSWVRRAKFAEAAALLKLGDFEAAEHIYEEEVTYLLSTERKHTIASIYLEFADAYFDPPKKAGDGATVSEKKPDYAKALNFYRQALAVGPEADRRIEIDFRIARCQQELAQLAESAASYQGFLKAHPKSTFDIEARYQLGAVQLGLGQNADARRTWKDLLDAHANHKTEVPKELLDSYVDRATQRLAEAAYGISHTYGLPNPPSKEDLELGAAAADRFVANFPDIKLAARSALEVAQGLIVHNRHDEAIDRLKKLIANPKYTATDVIPEARVLLGSAYASQKRFPQAIETWRDYLARHASHPSWAQVQKAIIDTEFLTALEARREGGKESAAEDMGKRFAEARQLWLAFLAKYPLDARAASIMLEFGLMNSELGALTAKELGEAAENQDATNAKPNTPAALFTAAIADWSALVSKYPNTEESSRAQYLIGLTHEEKFGKFDDALAAYRKLNWGQFAPRAAERIARLTRQELTIETERVFRLNQQPQIAVTTRNIKQVTVKAYRVDLETYFRKMHLASGIEGLDIALIDPEKTWTFEVPGYGDYKQFVSHIDIPLEGPGVMAVTVSNEAVPLGQAASLSHLTLRPREATTMVMRSDLDILVKCSRNELFVFAENMRTGKPFADVKLLVSDGSKVFAEGKTGNDGVFTAAASDADKTWDAIKSSNDIRVFALTNTHFASNVVGLKGVDFAKGVSAKGYIYTERPTYRPGQLVHVRGVLRWVNGDEYAFDAGKKFKLDVYDSRNRQIRAEEVTLGEFGSFATRFVLPPEAPQGEYRVHVHDPAEPERHNYQGTFAVHEYQLQPVQIEVDTPQKVYYRGDQIAGTIKLRYYYGSPVPEREIRYVLPDGVIRTEKTNTAGEVPFKFDTREFREDQMLTIAVQFPEMNLQSGVNLFLSTHGFRAAVATNRDVFLAGETFDVSVTTTDAAGKKTGEKMTLAVVERTTSLRPRRGAPANEIGERTVEELHVTTDKASGTGRATVKIASAGTYVLRATGTDRFGNPVSAERAVTISGDDDTVRLRILSDRHHYKAGDVAGVQIHWRDRPALALVTYQGARVLGYRLVDLKTGTNDLEIPITEKLAPNFDLTVSVMSNEGGNRTGGVQASNAPVQEPEPVLPEEGCDDAAPAVQLSKPTSLPSFHEASSPFEVERPLIVTVKPKRDRVLPGEELEVAVTATDPQGKPVRAELSVAMIEKSLLENFPDVLPAIGQFFEGNRRASALRTVASCTFRYTPGTHDISQTLIAEAERTATVELERASRIARGALGDREAAAGDRPLGEEGVTLGRGMIVERLAARESAFGAVSDSAESFALAFSPVQSDSKMSAAAGLAAPNAARAGGAGGGFGGQQRGLAGKGMPVQKGELRKLGANVRVMDVDKSGIPFPDEPAIEYPNDNAWYRQNEGGWGKAGAKFHYFSDHDWDSLQEYAREFLSTTEGKPTYKRSQLNLLYDSGTVDYVDALSVRTGKLAKRLAAGGVTVLPEGAMRETGYWSPSVVTDEKGNATVSITMPDRSTAWQIAAKGITTGTLTGQATSEVVAKKDLFGELKLPLAFVDGDSAQVLATIHNDAVQKGKIEVRFTTTIAGKTREEKRTIDVEKTGTHELTFDREIAGTGEGVFELAVTAIGAPAPLEDKSRVVVPIRPYGIPVFATTGGSATSNMTAWVSPPTGMPVRDPVLQIVIGPSVERSLLDVVLAPGGAASCGELLKRIAPESALERNTSDLIASLGLLRMLGESRENGSPEAAALADRVRSGIGYLASSQNDDGGWHWSAARGTKQGSSDRAASARALWALALARKSGFAVPEAAFNNGITFVQSAFTAARENDYDGKTQLLHTLSATGRGDFGYANRLYRSRTSLNARSLAYLALAFVEMDRKEIAREVLDLLGPKLSGGEAARTPGSGGRGELAEVQSLYLLGLDAVMPGDAKVKNTADWLMAHRAGARWQPERATGPATLALAEYYATTRFSAEHYKLKVFVNDSQVTELDIDGAGGSRVVDVPKQLLARGEKLPEKDFPGEARKQRINFEITGRGRFTYNCLYSGFVAADQLKSTVSNYHIERHYEPAPQELDGKEIPRGFDVLDGPFTTWRNPVTELPVGRRAQVLLYYYPVNAHLIPEEDREYVVITEPIPSGCTVLEKSITGQFDRYEVGPDAITFYVGNRSQPNEIRFDIYGYTPGKYRTVPTIVRNFYDPERMAVTQPRPLAVVASGQKSKDEYRLTPRELYELGKRHLERAKSARRSAEGDRGDVLADADFGTAGKHLAQLFDSHTLKPEIYKDVAQMLFEVSLAVGKAPEIVRYFEVIKEKYPDLEVSFDQIVKVGQAYRALNEYERSYLVFRATAEASFTREIEIGGFLESQGEFERSVAVMDRILREYPAEAYVASASYALAQRVYAMAPNAATDAKLREKRITKVDLIRDAVARIDDFLTVWPDDPAADQASFSIASALVELEAWPAAVTRANRFAERFPKSEFLDSFWYIMGYSHFAQGEHREALDLCRRVAETTHSDPATGRVSESRNKWRAIYISGQVHHALGEPSEAIADYSRVADRFPDAKETIAFFTRRAIELPEITAVKPPKEVDDKERPPVNIDLKFRNVGSCELKVYRIDLLKFGLLQRDLSNITRINLAGIKPLFEATVELGDGKDYRDRTKQLELPLKDEGAYLVVCRGEDLHTSGLVLVTPLVLDVQEEPSSGRVRATVKNSVTDKYAPDVHVKVIGSRNDKFKDGPTDLRGVFVTDGVQGRSTVIARAGDGQYAFYRGQLELGPPPAPAKPEAAKSATQMPAQQAAEGQQQELLQDLFKSNRMIQEQKGKELKELYEKKPQGLPAQQAF